jgi:uncharacterized membrane-anchored protein
MILRIAALVVAQLALVGGAVAPQLVSRVTGEDYLLRVAPVDPIDPFRGAYVTLSYPDLRERDDSDPPSLDDGDSGEVFVTLVEQDGFWVLGERSRSRPADGPYLACSDRDWAISCGIESYFVPQDEAAELERGLADGGVAVVRIDSRGTGTVMSVDPE